MTLGPSDAVAAGAQWQVDGGAWLDSGATVSGLAAGGRAVGYKDVSGWTAAAGEQVTITANQTLQISRTYTAAPPSNTLKINFQVSGIVPPAGYIADTGLTYRSQNGQTYGWSVDQTDKARQRGVNADLRLDTLNQFHVGSKWEIALAAGSYDVLVCVGIPRTPRRTR